MPRASSPAVRSAVARRLRIGRLIRQQERHSAARRPSNAGLWRDDGIAVIQRSVLRMREVPRLFGARRADGGTAPASVAPNRWPLDHGLTVGRQAMPGQVVLDHPNVSRRHAEFEVAGGTVVVRDLGGTNGTYVNGELVRGAQSLVPGDRINIGPFELTFDGSALRAWQSGNVELQVRGISYDVRINRAGAAAPQRILHGASMRIRPSEFVCIIGANGAGKSTLMNIMAGRALPSEGSVLFNGVDLHANFQALKRDIAFVPQQDVLHEQLTLREALDYTARLRLPPDTTAEQRRAAVDGAASSVDLFDRLDQRIGALSGGQKKCASLASEILSRPSVLFLDEVTSGLDESTDWDIMRLLRRLADEGMTIVVVTHTLANVAEFCDKIICMGRGGQPTFIGTFPEVLDFFAVRRLGEVFNCMDELGAESWRARFEQTVGATANLPPAAIARPGRQRANAAPSPRASPGRDACQIAAHRRARGHSAASEHEAAAGRPPYAGHVDIAEPADRRTDRLRLRHLRCGTGADQRTERAFAAARPERDLARLQRRVEGDRR